MYPEIKEYVSFENGKYSYINANGSWNLYRHKEFQRLASKPEISMVHRLIELENSCIIEYDCDGRRVK